ncbi:UbiA-like protein EboC [Parapedobacter sp. DT-150]|uniref:UbiA-like protein EboC n=1 Tax=Parapedobacter sp. DT-150 TaxID=3396162 RepID=UPI003F1C0ED2
MLKPFLQLMRPANVMTAISDVLAGAAIAMLYLGNGSTALSWPTLALLALATAGLYGGGVVFNDVFDAALDAKERPERPIPSGRVPLLHAVYWGTALFAVGVLAAGLIGVVSGGIAIAIVLMCLVYDRWAKHHAVMGPVAMGLCRGLNLLLGISYAIPALEQAWFLAFIPVVYIAGVTTISRGEVHGGKKMPLLLSAGLYALVIGLIAYFGVFRGEIGLGLGMLAAFALFIYPPLMRAVKTQDAPDIRKAVKHGVLGLIFMNAAWTAAAGSWPLTLLVLSLFPISIWLSKLFSVT